LPQWGSLSHFALSCFVCICWTIVWTIAWTQVMKDLLDMSARMLVLGGRLAYLLPCTSVFTPDELPVHPCLATVANCEEKLTLSLSRRVIVMEKVGSSTCRCRWAATMGPDSATSFLRVK
jgi:hypothetical protein